ncbi:DUF4139 domain-containing protein [Chitinophaga sp. Cy-1792]|uniref:DUF4139 domain-containing protein n=1 Tax=Chitinophaga sp. Cy-1792 TaxID=2608339 RepID=UPI0014228F6B|nr:DUF4139 domain-containing protein [Chitinophaga sp. Cy-1792]
MKHLLLLPLALVVQTTIAQTKKQTISTSISKVTVFLKGAQVDRSGSISLPAGTSQVIITDVSPDLEEKSIQVNGSGNFTLLAVSRQPNIMHQQTKREEISALYEQLDKVKDQIEKERNNAQVYTEERNMLLKNQNIGGNNGLKATDLQASLDFQRARLSENLNKTQEINKIISAKENDKRKIEAQLAALNNLSSAPTSDIILDLQAKEPVNGKINVSYLVKNAGWIPSYDIRVKDINHPLSLVYKANVYQQCGEDWKNVKLSLSTGVPDESNSKPILTPWYLRQYYSTAERDKAMAGLYKAQVSNDINGTVVDESGNPLPGVVVKIKNSSIGTNTDANGKFHLQKPSGDNIIFQFSYIGFQNEEAIPYNYMSVAMRPSNTSLSEVVVTGYGDTNDLSSALQGRVAGLSANSKTKKAVKSFLAPMDIPEAYTPTTVMFDIPVPYSIPPDGKPYTVGIKELEVDAGYQYYAVPKLDKAAFLMANITDWESFNLLDGEASIYYEGTYLGKTLLEMKSGNDTLQLSLGKDKQVLISRTLQKDESRKSFIGGRTTLAKSWEIAVRNNKQTPINIIVQDQLPIKVAAETDVSKVEYGDASLDEDTKILSWNLKIPAAGEQKRVLKYSVTYPKGMITNVE